MNIIDSRYIKDFGRPVLILNKSNENSMLILPITSGPKEGEHFYNIIMNTVLTLLLESNPP